MFRKFYRFQCTRNLENGKELYNGCYKNCGNEDISLNNNFFYSLLSTVNFVAKSRTHLKGKSVLTCLFLEQ